MRVGFIGLGVVGSAMAGHLAKVGHILALCELKDPPAVQARA